MTALSAEEIRATPYVVTVDVASGLVVDVMRNLPRDRCDSEWNPPCGGCVACLVKQTNAPDYHVEYTTGLRNTPREGAWYGVLHRYPEALPPRVPARVLTDDALARRFARMRRGAPA